MTRPIMTRDELAAHKVATFGRDYSVSDDGYGDMEVNADKGWKAVSSWGRDGWDLGDWPLVVISVGNRKTGDQPYRLLQVCEGDHDIWGFDTPEDREATRAPEKKGWNRQ